MAKVNGQKYLLEHNFQQWINGEYKPILEAPAL